jgi:hypothetical protein
MISTLRLHELVQIVMVDKQKISRNSETDRYIQFANDFIVLAEKELSAFIRAVQKLFGAEQARKSALHWIEELELMDWPSGDSIPDWRQVGSGARRMDGFLPASCVARRLSDIYSPISSRVTFLSQCESLRRRERVKVWSPERETITHDR